MGKTSFRDIATTAMWRGGALLAAALCCSVLAAAAPGPASAAAPAICPVGQQPSSHFISDFEDPGETLSTWRASLLGDTTAMPGDSGQLSQSHWHYPPPGLGRQPWSGSLNVWADVTPGGARPGTAESVIELQKGIQLPAGAHLSFVHRFDFTASPGAWGFVEHSFDGGLTWQQLGGFRGSIDRHHSSYFDLSAAGGSALRLRFRMTGAAATGEPPADGGGFRGWAIDDVHVYACVESTVAEPVEAGGAAGQVGLASIGIAPARSQRILKGRTQLKLRLVNGTRNALRRARVCFRAPRRLIAGNRCVLLRLLPAGSTAEFAFPIRITAVPAIKRRPRVVVGYVVRRGKSAIATAHRAYRLAPERDPLRRVRSRKKTPG